MSKDAKLGLMSLFIVFAIMVIGPAKRSGNAGIYGPETPGKSPRRSK
jgi:hypothetical protein